MKRVLPLVALLLVPAPAIAALNPEADKPYAFQVVIRFGSHSWLGEQFRDDVRSDLGGILKDALGGLADVTLVDLKKVPETDRQPLWKEVESKGLAAVGSVPALTGGKTHFLRIDFVDGQYELQARQYDGATGLVSPLRRDRTPDRALVTRLAARMIGQDFGLVGTVVGRNKEGTVTFRGGALTNALERWVHRGDVFALYRVVAVSRGAEAAKTERADRVPDTVVQVTDEPKNGACPCRIVFRGERSPLDQPGVAAGFRCIKLGATVGPMRLRLVDERGQPHNRTLQVRVHGSDFQTGESPDEEVLNPDRNGVFLSKKVYDHLSFARVVTGARVIAKVPVEIVDERAVTVTVGLSAEQEAQGQLQYQRAELRRMYDESKAVFLDRRAEVMALIAKGKYDEALVRARACRSALDEDMRQLADRSMQLKKEIGDLPIKLTDCEQIAQFLGQYKELLDQRIGDLEEAQRVANDPARKAAEAKLQELHTQARARADSYDYDGAIAILKQIVNTKEFGEQPKVQKELTDLEKAWAIRSDDHRLAREFVYKEWPALKNSAELETKLPVARQKLQVLVQAKDDLTLYKLRATLVEIGKFMRKEIEALSQNPDDMDKAARLKKVGEEFDKFSQEVESVIQGKSAAK